MIPWANVARYLSCRVRSLLPCREINFIHPPKVVRLFRISHGIVGSTGAYFSYTMDTPINRRPLIRVSSTCTDAQGNRIPANVKPVMASVVPATIKTLPLHNIPSGTTEVRKTQSTYNQSTRFSLPKTEPSGVFTLKNIVTTTKARPQTGRLRSENRNQISSTCDYRLYTYRKAISMMFVQERHPGRSSASITDVDG